MVEVSTSEPAQTVPPRRGRPKKITPPDPKQETFLEEEPAAETPNSAGEEIFTDPLPQLGAWAPGQEKCEQKISPSELLKYRNALTPAQQKYTTIYVYRLHPKMKLQPWRGALVNPQCEKFSYEDGEVTRDTIWARRRTGIYLLRLNQRVTKPYGTIALAEIELAGSGDWKTEDMPVIDDLKAVDWEHPANQEYARICRSRGIVKPDPTQGEQEDMAAQEVLGSLASKAIDVLADRPSGTQQGNNNNNDGLASVVSPIVNLLEKQITHNRPPAEQATVQEQLTGLVSLAKTMTPAAPDMNPVLELQRENTALIREMMARDVERYKEEAKQARQEYLLLKDSLPKQKSIDEQFDDLERAAKRYARIRGREQQEEENGATPAAPQSVAGFFGFLNRLPDLLTSVTPLVALCANIYANSKLAPGALPLSPITGQPMSEPIAPTPVETEAEMTPQQQEQAMRLQKVIDQLIPLAQPMIDHFGNGQTGAQFAQFVVAQKGPAIFGMIQSVDGGRNTLITMIQAYPQVWNLVGNPPDRAQKFVAFLDEFLAYQPVAVN